jgi:hypothetical protein
MVRPGNRLRPDWDRRRASYAELWNDPTESPKPRTRPGTASPSKSRCPGTRNLEALGDILTDARRGSLAVITHAGHTVRDASDEWLRYLEHEKPDLIELTCSERLGSCEPLRRWG